MFDIESILTNGDWFNFYHGINGLLHTEPTREDFNNLVSCMLNKDCMIARREEYISIFMFIPITLQEKVKQVDGWVPRLEYPATSATKLPDEIGSVCNVRVIVDNNIATAAMMIPGSQEINKCPVVVCNAKTYEVYQTALVQCTSF